MTVLKLLVSAALLGTVARSQNSPQYYQAYSPGGSLVQYSPSIYNRGTARLVPIKNQNGQQVQYHTAATSAPAVVKRGRILASSNPYGLESAAASSASAGGGFQYAPHSIPAVSTYRPAPQYQPQQQQYRPQIAAAPVHLARPQPQPQYANAYQPQQQYQPQFYIQKSPHVVGPDRPRKLIKVKKVQALAPTRGETAEAEEEEYPGDPNPQYNFSFDIKDDELTNYQNRQEERDGQTIKGSYSVVDPDGYVRTVTYTADPKNGFQAKVTREPTDVKIKFPVPTQAPERQQALNSNAPGGRRQTYINPQQYQPQYQSSAYATQREVYANAPSATSTVQVQTPISQPIPSVANSPFTTRSSRRVYSIQPQASASAPQPRVVSVPRRTKSESKTEPEQQSDSQSE